MRIPFWLEAPCNTRLDSAESRMMFPPSRTFQMPENRFRNTKGSQPTQILNLQSDRWHTAYSNRGSRSLRLSYMCLRKRAVSPATTFSNSSYHCLRFLLGNVSGLFVQRPMDTPRSVQCSVTTNFFHFPSLHSHHLGFCFPRGVKCPCFKCISETSGKKNDAFQL